MKPPDDKIPEGFMSDQHNVVIANEVRLVDAAGNTRLLLTTSSGTPSLQFLSGNGTVGIKADLDQEGRGAFRIQNPEAQGPVAGIEVVHCNVTAHPTAAWTFQQLREASDHSYRFLIHDRDAIFSAEVEQQLKAFGLRVLRKPVRAPKANAYVKD